MKQQVFGSLLCLIVYCSNGHTNETKAPEPPPSMCSREILLTFFPKPIVLPILIQHKISESDAEKIADSLAKKDTDIIYAVEEKVLGQFKGNKSPAEPDNSKESLRAMGVRIFKESLYLVFSKTIDESGVKIDETQAHAILDEIQDTKGKLFLKCIQSKFSLPAESK